MKNFLLLSILSSLAFGVELPLEDKNYYLAQETLIESKIEKCLNSDKIKTQDSLKKCVNLMLKKKSIQNSIDEASKLNNTKNILDKKELIIKIKENYENRTNCIKSSKTFEDLENKCKVNNFQ